MKYLPLLIAATMVAFTGFGQNKESREPDEKIIVNREYDEQGNLLRFDSVYSFRWHTDSVFQFPGFGGWKEFFGHRSPFHDHFSGNLFPDSLLLKMPYFRDFPPRFFSDQDDPFSFGFPDSLLLRDFSFHSDTTFFLGPDSSFLLPPGFIMPGMNSLRELLEEFGSFPGGSFDPFMYREMPRRYERFRDREYEQEWRDMLERHRREIEELNRRWERKEENRIY